MHRYLTLPFQLDFLLWVTSLVLTNTIDPATHMDLSEYVPLPLRLVVAYPSARHFYVPFFGVGLLLASDELSRHAERTGSRMVCSAAFILEHDTNRFSSRRGWVGRNAPHKHSLLQVML